MANGPGLRDPSIPSSLVSCSSEFPFFCMNHVVGQCEAVSGIRPLVALETQFHKRIQNLLLDELLPLQQAKSTASHLLPFFDQLAN